MPRTASTERPLKRQKSCIDYDLVGPNEDSEQARNSLNMFAALVYIQYHHFTNYCALFTLQDGLTVGSSPMPEDSPAQDPFPTKTPGN